MDQPINDSGFSTAFQTALGWFAIAWTEQGLSRFTMGHPSAQAALIAVGGRTVASDRAPEAVTGLIERFQAYAAGEQVDFADVALDLSHLTQFQLTIVNHCRRIARGTTLTYGQLAAKAGSPRAARAVGSVMAKNRFPIIVPCHRVVGSGGGLGGFSAPQGITMKTQLLALEGCALVKPKRASLYA
jgi:methylated-DNA-[protein]-cysteine S-methyltransferase